MRVFSEEVHLALIVWSLAKVFIADTQHILVKIRRDRLSSDGQISHLLSSILLIANRRSHFVRNCILWGALFLRCLRTFYRRRSFRDGLDACQSFTISHLRVLRQLKLPDAFFQLNLKGTHFPFLERHHSSTTEIRSRLWWAISCRRLHTHHTWHLSLDRVSPTIEFPGRTPYAYGPMLLSQRVLDFQFCVGPLTIASIGAHTKLSLVLGMWRYRGQVVLTPLPRSHLVDLDGLQLSWVFGDSGSLSFWSLNAWIVFRAWYQAQIM